MDIAAILLPLVGVVLGTLGTLTGQYLATRGAARRHADERVAAQRAERKESIVGFLDRAERIEELIDERRRGRPLTEAMVGERMHALWQAKKLVELVCSHELATAAHRYVRILQSGSRDEEYERHEQRDARGAFMEAARRELGVEGPPLYRG